MKKCHRLGGLENGHLCLTVLEDEKSKMKVPPDLASGEGFPLGLQRATFLLCPHTADRDHVSPVSS